MKVQFWWLISCFPIDVDTYTIFHFAVGRLPGPGLRILVRIPTGRKWRVYCVSVLRYLHFGSLWRPRCCTILYVHDLDHQGERSCKLHPLAQDSER